MAMDVQCGYCERWKSEGYDTVETAETFNSGNAVNYRCRVRFIDGVKGYCYEFDKLACELKWARRDLNKCWSERLDREVRELANRVKTAEAELDSVLGLRARAPGTSAPSNLPPAPMAAQPQYPQQDRQLELMQRVALLERAHQCNMLQFQDHLKIFGQQVAQ